MWPDHDEPISEPASKAKPGGRGKPHKQQAGKPRAYSKNTSTCTTGPCRERGGVCANQQKEYKRQYQCLWKVFLTVMDRMRCRDPERVDLVVVGKNCCDLGGSWCMLMPKNRCGSLYLHTIMMHTDRGDFMEHLLKLNLTQSERQLLNKVLAAVGAHAQRTGGAGLMGLLRSARIQREHSAGAAGGKKRFRTKTARGL